MAPFEIRFPVVRQGQDLTFLAKKKTFKKLVFEGFKAKYAFTRKVTGASDFACQSSIINNSWDAVFQ